MTLDEAEALVERLRAGPYRPDLGAPGMGGDYDVTTGHRTFGRYSPSPSAVLGGGPSPNDLHRARAVLYQDLLARNPNSSVADLVYVLDNSMGGYELREAIARTDPDGPRRGANRAFDADARRAQPKPPPPQPRGAPAPTPSAGAYDDLMRQHNPSFRQSRAFGGTQAQATGAALRHPVLGKGMSRAARQGARVAGAKALGVAGPFVDYAFDEARTPTQFLRNQEEFLTQRPILGLMGLGARGLVSPSELPPPAVLTPDRLQAVEAMQGMIGVTHDLEQPNVTHQEVLTFVRNKMAKGDKLPAWASKISSMKNGRLVVETTNPRHKARSKARQDAAKRPQNPRMGPVKRKHGGGY